MQLLLLKVLNPFYMFQIVSIEQCVRFTIQRCDSDCDGPEAEVFNEGVSDAGSWLLVIAARSATP